MIQPNWILFSVEGAVDLADVVHLLRYLFLEGPEHVLGRECLPFEGCVDVCP